MITLDFALAVGLFSALALNAVLLAWVFVKKGRAKELALDPKYTWFCSVCTHTYINTKEEAITVCPRCQSYNKKQG
jgi:Zn finger protein HypA/HybF involved in hydrogenase expression